MGGVNQGEKLVLAAAGVCLGSLVLVLVLVQLFALPARPCVEWGWVAGAPVYPED